MIRKFIYLCDCTKFFLEKAAFLFLLCICLGGSQASQTNAPKPPAAPLSSLNSTTIAPEANQLLGTISKLVEDKEEKKNISQKRTVNVSIPDLEAAVKILESNEDRKKLLIALKALYKLQEENEKKENILQKASFNITQAIETTAQVMLKIITSLGEIPSFFNTKLHDLKDPEKRLHFWNMLSTLITALLLAEVCEYVVRYLITSLNIHNPRECLLRNIPMLLFRNMLPLLVFGFGSYGLIYKIQGGWTLAASEGIYAVTILVMLRTSWLVLKTLFSAWHFQEGNHEGDMDQSTYQFTLACLQVIFIGVFFAETSSLLGLGDTIYDIWLRIIAFGVMCLVILGMYHVRGYIQEYFKVENEHIVGVTLLMSRIVGILGRNCHIIISIFLGISYILWITQFYGLALGLLYIISLSIGVTLLFILIRAGLIRLIHQFQNQLNNGAPTLKVAHLGYFEGYFSKTLLFLIHLLYFILLLECIGIDPLLFLSRPDIKPYVTKGVSIILTLFIAKGLWAWIDYFAKEQMMPKRVGKRTIEASQFVKTLTPILRSLAHWLLNLMTITLILIELEIPVEPIFYFFGFFGIALSLGAQGLIKDFINGVLNLMEGNIVVGEVVTIGNNTGVVENLSLRGVSIRHPSGALQTLAFSEVTNIINKSRNFTVVPIELTLPYHTEIGTVHRVLLSTYTDICKDPKFAKNIIDPLAITGIDRFTEKGYVVTGSIKVRPDPKNRFQKMFYQCLKERIEREDLTYSFVEPK